MAPKRAIFDETFEEVVALRLQTSSDWGRIRRIVCLLLRCLIFLACGYSLLGRCSLDHSVAPLEKLLNREDFLRCEVNHVSIARLFIEPDAVTLKSDTWQSLSLSNGLLVLVKVEKQHGRDLRFVAHSSAKLH